MSKVEAPLFSERATGRVGKSIIFRSRKGTKFASKFYFPGSKNKFTPSAKQSSQRANYKAAAEEWSALSLDQKQVYIDAAKGKNYTGYNLFMREFLSGTPTPPAEDFLLWVSGGFLILEDGGKIKQK